jgi:hypothetical protein
MPYNPPSIVVRPVSRGHAPLTNTLPGRPPTHSLARSLMAHPIPSSTISLRSASLSLYDAHVNQGARAVDSFPPPHPRSLSLSVIASKGACSLAHDTSHVVVPVAFPAVLVPAPAAAVRVRVAQAQAEGNQRPHRHRHHLPGRQPPPRPRGVETETVRASLLKA